MYDFMQNNIRQICLKIYLIFYHDHIKLKLRSYFHMPCKLPTGKKNRNNKRDYNITHFFIEFLQNCILFEQFYTESFYNNYILIYICYIFPSHLNWKKRPTSPECTLSHLFLFIYPIFSVLFIYFIFSKFSEETTEPDYLNIQPLTEQWHFSFVNTMT